MRAANAASTTVPRFERREIVALPALGLYGHTALSPAWQLAGRADLAKANGSDSSGSMFSLSLGAIWRWSPLIGLGAGYRHVDCRVGPKNLGFVTGIPRRSLIEYRLSGPRVFLDLGF